MQNCEEGKTKSLRTAGRLYVERVNGFNAFKYLTKHVKSKKVNKEFCGLRNIFSKIQTQTEVLPIKVQSQQHF